MPDLHTFDREAAAQPASHCPNLFQSSLQFSFMVRPGRGLPAYAETLVDEAEQVSGYPLELKEERVLPFDSDVQFAGQGRPAHVLRYLRNYRDHRDHFAVNAAYKIRRFFEADPDARYLPASDRNALLPDKDCEELLRKVRRHRGTAPETEVRQMARFLRAGLIRQLTSYPIDLRVEREIAAELPEHSDRQHRYLAQQVDDFLPTFNAEMLTLLPRRPWTSNAAMNAAFAEAVAEIAGVQPQRAWQGLTCEGPGQRLLALYHMVDVPGIVGDRRLTDAWADELGMREWYHWVQLRGP